MTSATPGLDNVQDFSELPLLLIRPEVAQLGRCSERTVIRAEHRGQLPAVRVNHGRCVRVLYRRTDVLRWLGLDEVA